MIKSSIEEAICKVNQIPLALVEELRIDGERIICQLKQPERARCRCGMVTASVKNRYPRTLVGIGLWKYRFEVTMVTTHFTCRNQDCLVKTFAPDLGIADGKSPFLPALKKYISDEYFVHQRNNGEVERALSSKYHVGVSEATLRRIAAAQRERPMNFRVTVVGLDELYPKGRHGVYLGMFDLERGVLLAVIERITQKAVEKLWGKVEQKGVDLSQVKMVVRDLYPHWDEVIKEKAGEKVTIIADPFHVVKRVQSLLYQEYWAPLRKQLQSQGRKEEATALFYARWAFKKGQERLSARQVKRLMPVLNQYRQLDQAWILKEKVRTIYQVQTRSEARKQLAGAIRYANKNRFWSIVRLLTRHQATILNRYEECGGRRCQLKFHPEERISQIRRVERRRGAFRKVETLVRTIQMGYQLAGVI